MSQSQSILNELKSLIRKYEDQEPADEADISSQPGSWQIRGGRVDAIQHDGTEEQANEIVRWVRERGGSILRRFSESAPGSNDGSLVTYLRIASPRTPDLVGPGWWVTRTADGFFFAVSDADFHIIYVPVKEG